MSQVVSINKTNDNLVKGLIFALIAASLWGVSGTFGQLLFQEKGLSVEWLITIRMLCSGSFLLLLAKIKKNEGLTAILTNKKDFISVVVFGISGMLAVQYAYFAAINYSNAATATILQFLAPVIIAIYLSINHKKWPRRMEILAIFLALSGMFLLVTHGDFSSLKISNQGLFWGIISAFTLSLYTLQPIKLLNKYSPLVVIGWAMMLGGLCFSFVCPPWKISGIWDYSTLLYVVFIVIFGTIIPFYMYLTAVKIIGGQKASLLASAEPLSAAIVSILWLKTPISWIEWVGGIMIISTVFILSKMK